MANTIIYKIVPRTLWQQAQKSGVFQGSEADRADGFIHFSTADQLAGTLEKHFSQQGSLLLISFESTDLQDKLKWEPARGGALFPHYYGPLPTHLAIDESALQVDETGTHVTPDLEP
ncbi:MAG: DUF952 domain-containing protein [Alphaproteobacteria bacterium]|nr:DUF952 domain-containing protein [Alphaproteobacteria bacterium]